MINTDRITIYTSRKKSFGMLLLALLMVAVSVWLLLIAEDIPNKNPVYVRVICAVSVLFFGLCTYVIFSRAIQNRIFLIIDSKGIDVEPEKASSKKIGWEHIEGFSEISIHGTKMIVIHVNDPDHWIDGEKSAIRRKMMRFNLDYCGSPFGISTGAARISHAELMKVLYEKWKTHRVLD